MSRIRLKRAYEAPSTDDGFRILVDRLWPRGLKRDTAKIDLWLKEIAPSADLRNWFGHDPELWTEFRKRYRAEFNKNADATALLRGAMQGHKLVTLLFAAKDEDHNNAVALKSFLEK
ncbi:MAG TPA: DUF488 domain-containing protein [Parvibaculum sp.]|jgi:DNA-3-methyladenine glycosylase